MNTSEYFQTLDELHRMRYAEKIAVLGTDPYLVSHEECSTKLADFPGVMYPDIVMYFVHTKSTYTMEEMKAYKSLEAYNQAVCGWVKKVCVKSFGSNILILGKVMHSQRLNEKLLCPWIICKKEGVIISAHCDCIAGLGEACSHIAAVLFSIDDALRKQESSTRTGIKAYWMPPSNRPVDPERIQDIDLRSAKRICSEGPLRKREKKQTAIPPLSSEEKHSLLSSLGESKGCALHLVTKPFCESIKEQTDKKKSFMIMALYKKEYAEKSLDELQHIGSQIQINLQPSDCEEIEKETKRQNKCKSWFLYRMGRITASVFKRCCRTDLKKPSISLIKQICYPTKHKYKIRAIDYGCLHEKDALRDFTQMMQKKHINFKVVKMGLCINPNYPHFGASPDGLSTCDCCGDSIVEVKCPYCARNSGIEEVFHKTSFLNESSGKISLKKDHSYFYQIQMQMALSGHKTCYFVVWSRKNVVVTEEQFDETFWNENSNRATQFFKTVILPEALGRYFTRDMETLETPDILDTVEFFSDIDVYEEVISEDVCQEITGTDIDEGLNTEKLSGKSHEESDTSDIEQPKAGPSKPTLYCICRQEDDHVTPMIACDSPTCRTVWYHMSCVGLSEVPVGQWICNICVNTYN